jgi:GDP-4-dehydro-6-deoxy-D-mannose reductase
VRVLVTGGSGFLGRHLVARLIARGDAVTALGLDPGPLGEEAHFVHADVCDSDQIARAVAASDPQVVVHLAALSHVGESWNRMPEYFEVNVLGTEHVAAAARGRQLLFASTAEVYGAVPEAEQPIPETRPPAPRSPYALTKAAAERLALASGAIVVRLFNLAGPGQAPSFALPSFAAQLATIARGAAPAVLKVGNLSARRDFLHVADAADALAELMTSGQPATVYNLASGTAVSIREALDRLLGISGVAARVERDPERLRPVDVPVLAGDTRRIAALGWRPRRDFDEALADLWREASAGGEAA